MPLWQGRAPGAQGDAPEDIPTLTIYMPPSTAGPMTAVIVAPGGGYRALSMNKEGRIPANYFNSLGIAAFVLKYRLGPKYHHPIELGDIQRAIRTVRSRAAEWHIAPDRIGIMGFSAGGHLSATASTHFDRGNASAADPIDRVSSRPDFAILGYPVITLTEPWTHQGSKTNLLGENAGCRARAKHVDGNARDERDAANLPVSHQRRHGRAGGKQHLLLSRAAESRRAGRDARVQRWTTRRRHADERRGAGGVAEGSRELDAGERLSLR